MNENHGNGKKYGNHEITKMINYPGEKIGSWTFLNPVYSHKYLLGWTVQCSCGFIALRRANTINNGTSRSCINCCLERNKKLNAGEAELIRRTETAREIRKLYRAKAFNQCQLASKFGVPQSTVKRIVYRTSWSRA